MEFTSMAFRKCFGNKGGEEVFQIKYYIVNCLRPVDRLRVGLGEVDSGNFTDGGS